MKKCMGCMEEFDENQTLCPHCGYEEGTMPAEVYHMEPGSILAKRYIVGKTLGYGGFGVTYIGYDAELERKVAIKEYLPGEFSTRVPGQTQVTIYDGERKEQFQSGIEKFMDEAKRLAKFQDTEGIVHIYDSFLYNDTAYIIMEYIDGETLKSKVEREGKLAVEDTLNIILPIVGALKAVHEAGIIHRDISPDNIMLSKEGKVSLIDFGASRFATSTHSKSLSVLIKPGYAPVEQYQSRGEQGPWTDVYALASTMYFALTAIVPDDAMERMGKDGLKSLSKLGIKAEKNIDTAIMNAMNLKIEERTPSMDVFEEELTSQKTVAKLAVVKEKKDVGQWPIWAKGTVGFVAVAICTFMVCVLTGVISFKEGTLSAVIVTAGNTIVPNVVNTTVEVAEAKSSNKKLKIQIVGKEYSDEIEEGIILSQNIAGGDVVEEDTVLEVVISAGKESVFMSSLIGKTKEEAIAWLEQNSIKYTIEEIESMSAPGTVASQSVAADEKIAKGDTVVLQISTGISGINSETEVIMPDLTKLTYTEAQKQMEELGLYLSIEASVYDMKVAKDKIISQSVVSGSTLHQGDSVTVVVSLGKEQVRVPYVQYETEANAKQMIANAGLMANVKYEYSETVKQGIVIKQGVEKDKLVNMGSTIEIVVSLGAQSTQTTQNKNTKWSGWVESLPAGVDNSKYDIETKTQYSYREKSTITNSDSTLGSQGWTLINTKEVPSAWVDNGWTDVAQTESNTLQCIGTETRYSYRDKQTTTANTTSLGDGWIWDGKTYWSNWSAYSDAYCAPSDTREVQTQSVDDTSKPITKQQWHYTKYFIHYYNANATEMKYQWFANESLMYDEGKNHESKANFKYNIEPSGWLDEKKNWYDSDKGFGDGSYGYNSHWFNEQTRTVTIGYEQKTQYRYRDRQPYQFYKWTGWSGYSATQVSATGTREVQIKQYYHYQSRTIGFQYTYEKWSDWSGYSDNAVSAQPGKIEVQTKTLYRYKEK